MPRENGVLHAKTISRKVMKMMIDQNKKERLVLMNRASTTAMNRLRKKHYEDYRAFYLEELDKAGIVIRTHASSETVALLQAEVKRLERLLAKKGVTA
jgi:hypothetical protein